MGVGATLTTPSQPAAAAPTNPLAALSAQQIRQQAVKTVAASYAPASQSLNQQAQMAQNIQAKREADNHYYLTWLDTQGAALQAHADAANQTLGNLESQLSGQQASEMAALPGSLVAGANARSGNVSNNANSNAFGEYLAPQIASQEDIQHGASAGALGAIGLSNDMMGAARANSAGLVAQGKDKETAAFDTTMQNIANERSKLRTAETGDVAKEIARLQNVEIQKAEYNQNYNAAAQKLGIYQANTASEINARNNQAILGQERVKLAATQDQIKNMQSDRRFKLDQQKYDTATAKDLYERQHGLGPYKPAANGAKKPLSLTSQNVIYNRVSEVQSELRQLMGNGADANTAYHVLLNGKTVNVPTGRTHNVKQTDGSYKPEPIYRTVTYKSPDVQLLNAAYNLITGNGLTKGDVAALEAMGLSNPGTRLHVASTVAKTGGAISTTGSRIGGF